MERIQRAMELARGQRSGQSAAGSGRIPSTSPPVDAATVVVPLSASGPEQAGRGQPIQQPKSVLSLRRELIAEQRLVMPDARGVAAHAYRMLRGKVQSWLRGTPYGILGIVSASEGEGKTLTAVNLAMQLASDPAQHVWLVEFDLRRPSMGRLFGIDGRRGVEDVLAGAATLEDVSVAVTELDRLRILPARVAAVDVPDPLAGPAPGQLLASLTSQQPRPIIVVDLPPGLLSSDLLILAPLLDAVLIVATEGLTRRDDLRRLAEILRGVRVIGTVLNMASDIERRAY